MAKKNIGKLSVVISASTKGLSKVLGGVKRSVSGFGRDLAAIGASIVNPVTLAAAGLGAVVSLGGLKQIAADIDATAKAADRLGLTTQALIGFQHGANLAGVASEEFNDSFQNMLKNTSLAAAGLGKAKRAFEFLNIDPEKLKGLSAENQFKVLAEKIKEIKNPADQVRIAMQLFGDQGAKLLPFLKEGAAGMTAMQTEAEQLGLTFDRIDAAKVEMANDALTRVKAVMTGIAQTLVIQLAPYVTALANKFTDAAKEGGGFGTHVVNALEKVTIGVSYLGNAVQVVKMIWHGLKAAVAQVLSYIVAGIGKLGEVLLKADDMLGGVLPASLRSFTEQSNAFAKGFSTGLEDVAAEAAGKFNDIAEQPWASDKVRAFFADVRKQADDAAKAIAANAPKPGPPFDPKMVDDVTGRVKEKTKEAAKEIARVLAPSENRLVRVGTQEAYAYTMSGPMKEMAKFQREQLALSKRQTQSLEEIAENTDPDNEVVYDLPG